MLFSRLNEKFTDWTNCLCEFTIVVEMMSERLNRLHVLVVSAAYVWACEVPPTTLPFVAFDLRVGELLSTELALKDPALDFLSERGADEHLLLERRVTVVEALVVPWQVAFDAGGADKIVTPFFAGRLSHVKANEVHAYLAGVVVEVLLRPVLDHFRDVEVLLPKVIGYWSLPYEVLERCDELNVVHVNCVYHKVYRE